MITACNDRVHSITLRDRHVQTFSSANWKAVSESERLCHALSNCVACDTQFEQLQSTFPWKPIFLCPHETENTFVNMEMVTEIGCQGTSMSFAKFSANLGYKTSEGKQIMKSTEKNCL